MGELIQPHERIQIEQSLKFSPEEAAKLWSSAGMSEAAQWKHDDEYGKSFHLRLGIQRMKARFRPQQELPHVLSATWDESYKIRPQSPRLPAPDSSEILHARLVTRSVVVLSCGAPTYIFKPGFDCQTSSHFLHRRTQTYLTRQQHILTYSQGFTCYPDPRCPSV
jgi:hypothetical protein